MLNACSYNAAVFQVTAYGPYEVTLVFNGSESWLKLRSNTAEYQELSNPQWQDIYSSKKVSGYGDLVLVIDRLAYPASVKSLHSTAPLPIGSYSDTSELEMGPCDWIKWTGFFVNEYYTDNPGSDGLAHVAYAFGQKTERVSRLEMSLVYLLIVIAFNTLKLAVMLWTLATDKHNYLVTLGDAVSSFLERKDAATMDRCTLNRDETLFALGFYPYGHLLDDELETTALRIQGMWLPQEREYFAEVGWDRKAFYILL